MSSSRRALSTNLTPAPQLPYWLLMLRYGEHITKAELAWCNEALKQFDGEIT